MKNTTQAVETARRFNAGVQALYHAWIDAEKLKQWWRPANNQLVQVENEVQPGGNIKYIFETAEGKKSFTITGQYKEVQPGEKLVYSWNWEMPGMHEPHLNDIELTVEFSGDQNNSHIHIRQHDLSNNEIVHPHQNGWEEELDSLARFLS